MSHKLEVENGVPLHPITL